ncbi:PACE efflux transporter [Ferrimonas sp. YFM]|uniref:PACE efflux transporter n=1 Tax=Ferrimonas sp. YFM TaxID=3028878 RepID=UPI00257323F6|nr:PACE efflux transporter [Ferrimonas sp. YFM]BDY06033.1 LysR family transcriptional regulator [Ferrimonas sp. YFM]
MSTKERILHTLLFEAFALAIIVGLVPLFMQVETHTIAGISIALSLIAMGWNYAYNLMFDKMFGEDRNSRSALVRLGHGFGFELGLLPLTLPVLMWALSKSLWEVLLLDIGFILFFLVYAIVFNWGYDKARAALMTGNISCETAKEAS